MTRLDGLRHRAVTRSLFCTDSLQKALDRFGFVQADPIRAPARAQDLTLRHRVVGYRSGDLERCYPELEVEEGFFVNYGFLSTRVHALMHQRATLADWPAARRKGAEAILTFVGERGAVHPRDVDRHFAHGRVANYWGGVSNSTTHMLDAMLYGGWLRVVRREAGVRVYGVQSMVESSGAPVSPDAQLDGLVDVIVGVYAPLPGASLAALIGRLRHCAPQWRGRVTGALQRAKQRLAHARVVGVDWYWPAGEPGASDPQSGVRLLAPFDPVVWDRRRFELFWGWAFRFEAYLPLAKRTRGYYALPLLWDDRVIGWGNVSVESGEMCAELGYEAGRAPRSAAFNRALEAELERMRDFLDLDRAQRRRKLDQARK